MKTESGDSLSKCRMLIERSVSVLAAGGSTALSIFSGEPILGVGLSMAGATGVYQKIGSEFADRLLGPREQDRIGSVLALSADILKSEIEGGKRLRSDGFFEDSPDRRSDADEILEAVLRKAQTEYEERKLPYLARLWANACLDDVLSPDRLNHAVKLSERFTYRQFVLITLAGKMTLSGSENSYSLRDNPYDWTALKMRDEISLVLHEIRTLGDLGCVTLSGLLDASHISPSRLRIGPWGFTLYHDMGLSRVVDDDPDGFSAVVRLLT